jgi:hypothetical protein
VDYRLSREYNVTEKARVEFLAEAFNLFNHPNISSVTTSQFSVGACAATSAASTVNQTCSLTANPAFATPSGGGIDNGTNLRERQLQFAVRVKF